MSETLATVVVAAIGIMLLLLASVVLALKVKGKRAIAWRGFGVEFRISQCSQCKFNPNQNPRKGNK